MYLVDFTFAKKTTTRNGNSWRPKESEDDAATATNHRLSPRGRRRHTDTTEWHT